MLRNDSCKLKTFHPLPSIFIPVGYYHHTAKKPILPRFYFFPLYSSAWIGALAVGLSYFAAPAVGRLSDFFGCRVMTICGSLLCALSLFATSFAKSISHVFVSYGILFGLGAACVRTCTFLVAAKHFDRRRSMATGLVSSGTGLGIFVFGPIAQELLGVLGLQNTYLVLAGFALFVCLLAVSFSSTTENTEEKCDKCIDEHVHKDQGAYSEKKLKTCFQRRKIFDFSPWRTPSFTVVTIGYAVIALGDYVPLIHLVSTVLLSVWYLLTC